MNEYILRNIYIYCFGYFNVFDYYNVKIMIFKGIRFLLGVLFWRKEEGKI